MAEGTPGFTGKQPWSVAIQLGEDRWIDMEAVIAFVDGHFHKIELPGMMIRSGKSFGLTVTFHTVAKAWRDSEVDRGDISRMVVVEGLLYSIDTIAQGVELVRLGKPTQGERTHGKRPIWLKDLQKPAPLPERSSTERDMETPSPAAAEPAPASIKKPGMEKLTPPMPLEYTQADKDLLAELRENLRANNEDPSWYDEKEERRNEHARAMKMDTPIPKLPPLNPDGSEQTTEKDEGHPT